MNLNSIYNYRLLKGKNKNMFLGIIDFGFNRFYLFGFLGYIVMIIYLILIFAYKTKQKYGFNFSIFLLFLYFCFVSYFTIDVKASMTYINQIWPIPFFLCIAVDGIGYLMKKHNKDKR